MGPLKLLLDAHVFYWWHTGDAALSADARSAIANNRNDKYVGAITAWELITKFRSGRESSFSAIVADVPGAIAAQGFIALAITIRHAELAASLPLHHKGPMDRFLIAQAIVEGMTLVTADGVFARYPVKLLW